MWCAIRVTSAWLHYLLDEAAVMVQTVIGYPSASSNLPLIQCSPNYNTVYTATVTTIGGTAQVGCCEDGTHNCVLWTQACVPWNQGYRAHDAGTVQW